MTLRSITEIEGYGLEAEDGAVGRCKDILFDDEHWTIRYMVASTGKWLPGRKVLISPIALGDVVDMTRQEVKESPELDPSTPINRHYETRLYDYYVHERTAR